MVKDSWKVKDVFYLRDAKRTRDSAKWWILYTSSVRVHVCAHRKPSACIQPGCRSSSRILRWAGRWWWWPTGSWRPAEHSLLSRAPHSSEEDKHNLSLLRVEPTPLSSTGSDFFVCGSRCEDNHLRKYNGSTASQLYHLMSWLHCSKQFKDTSSFHPSFSPFRSRFFQPSGSFFLWWPALNELPGNRTSMTN